VGLKTTLSGWTGCRSCT